MARYQRDSLFRISGITFNQIEGWMAAAEMSGRNIDFGMDLLVHLMARTNQAFAQEMSRGPVDQRMSNPGLAWKIPVRRISGRYYRGWRARRITMGKWMLYNNSREAFFIEYGINHVGQGNVVTYRDGRTYIKSAKRVRRPIRKLSLIKTLKFVDTTRTGDRVWSAIWAPFRPGRVYSSRLRSVAGEQIQATRGMVNL